MHLYFPSRTFSLVLAFLLLLFSVDVAAEVYEIDEGHSHVTFKIKHLGISTVNGSFKNFSGKFEFDEKNIAKSKVDATIIIKSIDTSVEKRDKHLLADDFFDEKKFPKMTFKSKSIKDVQGKNFKIVGDLTMHGVTKEVVLDTVFNGSATDPWGNEKVAFSAKAQLDRQDYGLTYGKLLETGGLVVANTVDILIEIEANKQKPEGEAKDETAAKPK